VAAALAGKLQVFDADSLNLLAEVYRRESLQFVFLTPNLHQILQHTYTLLDVAQDRSDLFWTSLCADNTGAQCRFGHLGSTITAFFLERMGSLPLVSARNLTLRHRSRGS
jgi:hypothetical protein